jgi:mono/diheme cytochrome c family protein
VTRLHAAAGLILGASLSLAIIARAQEPHDESGLHIFKTANCAGCHNWTGMGGGNYGGAAANLRATQLTRDQMIEVVRCGRVGTGMPHFSRRAYGDDACFGMAAADVPQGMMPPGPLRYLQPQEIETVVDYVTASVKGRGAPTFAECQAFYGSESRVCDSYETPAQLAAAGHVHPHVDVAPDANAGPK